jgi:hypothetical protein
VSLAFRFFFVCLLPVPIPSHILERTRIESKAEGKRDPANTHLIYLSFSFLLLLSVLCVWYDIDGMKQPGHARRRRRGRVGRQVQRECPVFAVDLDCHVQSRIPEPGSVVSFRGEVQAADTHHLSLLPRSILLSRHIGSYTSPRLAETLENRSDRYRQSWLSRMDNLSASSVSPTHWL